jgi:methionine synthase II (cobalamin-independent)
MPAPYRADQVGSFLRPGELLAARSSMAAEPETLRALEDRHVLRVIEKQKELGFEVFTDGELRRRNFMSDFTDAVEGFDLGDAVARSWQAGDAKAAATSKVAGIVTGKLRAVRRLTGHELPFLKAHSPGPIKITLPSATQFPAISWKRGITDAVYPDQLALLADIVAILKAELAMVAAEGASYIQIDAPRYSYFIDPRWREWIEAEMRIAPDTLLDASIEADNACLEAARRPGVTLAMHLCRGNNRSHWYAEGGYDEIAERLFSRMAVDRFLLEYDDARSGSFEPLRFVPKGKAVVLGLVSSKLAQLEDPDELARRIDEAARHVPLENLALSPQCGFASTMEGNLLTEDEQWAKLRLVVETARRVWS